MGQGAPGFHQGPGGRGGGGGRFGYRPGNGLGGPEGPADIDPVPAGGHRRKAAGLDEIMVVQGDAALLGQGQGVFGGLQAHRQHQHVEVFRHYLAALGDIVQLDADIVGAGLDGVGPGFDEPDPFGLGILVVTLKLLVMAAQVHVKNGLAMTIAAGVLGGDQALLHRVHAADRGAVTVAIAGGVPGTDALDPGHLVGFLAVRGPHQVAQKGAPGGEQPFVLHAGNHIRDAAVAEGGQGGGVEGLVARGQDDGADLEGPSLLFVVEIDGPGGAELDAGLAFPLGEVKAVVVNGVLQGYGLAVLQVNGLPFADPDVVRVIHLFGAFLGAESAGDALVHVHIARLFGHGDREIAFLSGNLRNFGEGEKLDV